LHSGCTTAAFIWFVVLTAFSYAGGKTLRDKYCGATVGMLTLGMCILSLSMLFAYPTLRRNSPAIFEAMHRGGGWTILGVFWIIIVLVALVVSRNMETTFKSEFLENPLLWLHFATTLLVIYPWTQTRMKRV